MNGGERVGIYNWKLGMKVDDLRVRREKIIIRKDEAEDEDDDDDDEMLIADWTMNICTIL